MRCRPHYIWQLSQHFTHGVFWNLLGENCMDCLSSAFNVAAQKENQSGYNRFTRQQSANVTLFFAKPFP